MSFADNYLFPNDSSASRRYVSAPKDLELNFSV